MTQEHKNAIVAEIKWMSGKTSQKRVATQAQVSPGTISQIIAGNHEHISDEMFRGIQGNLRIDLNWNIAITDNLKEAYHFCNSAQKQGLALLISDKAGKGKSNAYKYYDRRNDNVLHIECKASWSKKSFVKQLLITMGVKPYGTTEELLAKFNDTIKRLHQPLLILDQADKLKDPQLDLFMEFYNDHEGHLGIILSGVDALRKRIEKGVQRSKVGYDELYSRVGRKIIRLNPINKKDVAAICEANGVTDKDDKITIYDTCGGDLRRVRREIKKIHIAQQQPAELIA